MNIEKAKMSKSKFFACIDMSKVCMIGKVIEDGILKKDKCKLVLADGFSLTVDVSVDECLKSLDPQTFEEMVMVDGEAINRRMVQAISYRDGGRVHLRFDNGQIHYLGIPKPGEAYRDLDIIESFFSGRPVIRITEDGGDRGKIISGKEGG